MKQLTLSTNSFKATIVFCILFFISACGGGDDKCQGNECIEIKQTISETINAYFDDNILDTEAGVSVLVQHEGLTTYKNSKGMADINSGYALSNETGFRLASVSKPFTALAIMQFYEQGLIALDDSILIYLPDLPSSWSEITIHHLLSHQSGIPDFYNDFNHGNRIDEYGNADVIEFFSQYPTLEFLPGSKTDYSNTGFIILAEIVSQLSGLTFAEYMKLYIFEPAQMFNSYVINENQNIIEGDALNFGLTKRTFNFNIYTHGSMAQVSSLNDFEQFSRALLNGEIVNLETLALMKSNKGNDTGGGGYGYGWLFGFNNDGAFGHYGSWDGFKTVIAFSPDSKTHLVILTNGGSKTEQYRDDILNLVKAFYGY